MAAQGYIHLYTGNGKGKSTAALGLAIRAAGAGKNTFFAQFVKGMHYSELNAIERFPEIKLKQYGRNCFIVNKPTHEDVMAAQLGFEEVCQLVKANQYNIVVLDEICIALYYELIRTNEVLDLLNSKPYEMEIVITGRYAPQELIERADLVTEMREIKHYFNEGVEARLGIEF